MNHRNPQPKEYNLTESKNFQIKQSSLVVLRYSRAFTLTIKALHTMCCGTGNTRDRLQQIDLEFYTLRPEAFPENDGIRATFIELQNLVSSKDPAWSGGGRIEATLADAHHTKLNRLAEKLWNLHRKFSVFMNGDGAA
jgi:hypothetical protein